MLRLELFKGRYYQNSTSNLALVTQCGSTKKDAMWQVEESFATSLPQETHQPLNFVTLLALRDPICQIKFQQSPLFNS